jgi:DNA-binding MarR family transcriptional regulator
MFMGMLTFNKRLPYGSESKLLQKALRVAIVFFMQAHECSPLRQLIDRVARLAQADGWSDGLNPSQRAALRYLAQANRFSCAPSHVAAYLGATRGTVSQTLHVLERKGFITAHASATDRRTISYRVTTAGHSDLARVERIDQAIDALPMDAQAALQAGLAALLREVLVANGGRSFGLCHTCRYHLSTADGAQCALLGVSLSGLEATQICQEHAY